jgi:hypothetical protein
MVKMFGIPNACLTVAVGPKWVEMFGVKMANTLLGVKCLVCQRFSVKIT